MLKNKDTKHRVGTLIQSNFHKKVQLSSRCIKTKKDADDDACEKLKIEKEELKFFFKENL